MPEVVQMLREFHDVIEGTETTPILKREEYYVHRLTYEAKIAQILESIAESLALIAKREEG